MDQTATQSIFEQMEIEQPAFIFATNQQRFINYLVDSAISLVLYFSTLIVIGVVMAINGASEYDIKEFGDNRLVLIGISTLATIVYYFLIEGLTKGRTVGKLITRTVAVKEEDLSPITWKDAFIRTVSRCVPFDAFSIFGQGLWHDKWSKTTVIKKRRHII